MSAARDRATTGQKSADWPQDTRFTARLWQTRALPVSPLFLIQFLLPITFMTMGGSVELTLLAVLVCLFNCLPLTLIEFAGFVLVCNLVFLMRGWFGVAQPLDAEPLSGILIINILLCGGRYMVTHRMAGLAAENRLLIEMAMVDSLTGAYNRRYLSEIGQRLFHSYSRRGSPFCVMLIDIDHFKRINDGRGHAEGDRMLIWLAGLLRDNLRTQDIAGRYGGDEFLGILPETTLDKAVATARRIKAAINQSGSRLTLDAPLCVSIGLAEIDMADEGFTDVVRRADDALYQAKRTGRNSVRTWQPAIREEAIAMYRHEPR